MATACAAASQWSLGNEQAQQVHRGYREPLFSPSPLAWILVVYGSAAGVAVWSDDKPASAYLGVPALALLLAFVFLRVANWSRYTYKTHNYNDDPWYVIEDLFFVTLVAVVTWLVVTLGSLAFATDVDEAVANLAR